MAKSASYMARNKAANTEQAPTNARAIENMNEAQINNEISSTKRAIARADKAIGANDITNTAEARALREAFPGGVGGDGWTVQKVKARNRGIEKDAEKAAKFAKAYSDKQAAQARLSVLEKAKNKVKGTGKTVSEIQKEKRETAVKTAPKTMKWQTTTKGGWSNGGYLPKIIKSGSFEIHGTNGLYEIFKDGKSVGRTSKLSLAKAYAERLNK